MSIPASSLRFPDESGKVVNLRNRTGSANTSEDSQDLSRAIREALSRQLADQTANIQAVIEQQLEKSFSRLATQVPTQESGPFDAVYIAQLAPDHLLGDDYARLSAHAAIQDRSEELVLNDGLDD